MIQKGIVKQLLFDENKISVRVPIFETPGSEEAIFDCNIMIQPGIITGYNIDDVVYVDFENDQYEHPVVVGKLYTGNDNVSHSAFLGDTIDVSGKAKFSTDFNVGDITYTDILATVKQLKQDTDENRIDDYFTKDEVTDLINSAISSAISKIAIYEYMLEFSYGRYGNYTIRVTFTSTDENITCPTDRTGVINLIYMYGFRTTTSQSKLFGIYEDGNNNFVIYATELIANQNELLASAEENVMGHAPQDIIDPTDFKLIKRKC